MTNRSEKLGHDPLAWLGDAGESEQQPRDLQPTAPPVDRRRGRGRRKTDQPLAFDVLETSFQLLEPQAEELVKQFYDALFERYPQVEPLFAGVSRSEQEKKLLAALKLVINSLRKPRVLGKTLRELGSRHQAYGALPEHYDAVGAVLLDVMAELAGENWTTEVATAWADALKHISDVMLKAYTEQEKETMAASKKTMEAQLGGAAATAMDDLGVLQNILERAPINIMMADAEENIIFVNARAREALEGLEHELAKYLPGFKASEVMGGSIHRYHKDPAAIKAIIHRLGPDDVRKGEITPGPYIFEHETRVLVNSAGERIGYVVQWQDATERRAKEEQAQRLQTSVDGAQTAIMTIDRDLVITYANRATQELMDRNGDTLRALYPGFEPSELVGTCIDIFHKNPAHQRGILANPANLPFETDIQVGPLTFHIRASAIHDLQGEYVGNTLEWSDVTELRKSEINVARLQSAVDGAAANLMICDADLNITYANPAVVEMLSSRANELRQAFPGFDPNNLVGTNIDIFHKNPGHQRALLADMNRLPFKAEISVAGLEFGLNATAIVGPNGEYMGNMVQWTDITEQKDGERQIENLIQAAVIGNLEERIDTSRYSGFMANLGNGVNSLLDAVVTPVRETARVMSSLSEGDLTQQMEGDFQGEFAALRDAINGTMDNLLGIVSNIREAAGSITTSAGEIAQGNQDLSQRTEEQASSLEETASSMEQLTGTVKQNADNARQANQLASGARDQAEKGGEVVSSAIAAMAEINGSSKKIADIIGVIDEIAFQTNLLALNAAVEAARAGEQGRGFAVVASEVRNLAQRSAAAAKEIKSLIKDSVEKVEDGSRLVNQSGETLSDIVNAVKRVSDIIAEIAAASQEQSAGIDQINKAVMQMDEVTQQNAALVEQAAAASGSMDDQARGLQELMAFFNIGEEESAPAPMRRAEPPRRAAPAPAARRAAPTPARKAAPAPRAASSDDGEWEEF
jgi:methyl-accepting chemotaxis protein